MTKCYSASQVRTEAYGHDVTELNQNIVSLKLNLTQAREKLLLTYSPCNFYAQNVAR